jgi:hypothetical protein
MTPQNAKLHVQHQAPVRRHHSEVVKSGANLSWA